MIRDIVSFESGAAGKSALGSFAILFKHLFAIALMQFVIFRIGKGVARSFVGSLIQCEFTAPGLWVILRAVKDLPGRDCLVSVRHEMLRQSDDVRIQVPKLNVVVSDPRLVGAEAGEKASP